MFDPKCHALAAEFLTDHPSIATPERVNVTAQAIQDAIEDTIAGFRGEPLGDCVSCDGYVTDQKEAPHCATCARLIREGKQL